MQHIDGQFGGRIKAFVDGVEFEEAAKVQVHTLASMPFIHPHIAIMPDVHHGKGSTIGSVIPTVGAIIPAAVGVDIGCGMMAVRTSLTAADLPDNLHALRSLIEAAVPHGRTDNGGPGDVGSWRNSAPEAALIAMHGLARRLDEVAQKQNTTRLNRAATGCVNHLGTLGSGNHFVEVCLDQVDRVWVMLHSGSRGIGNQIGQHFIELAKQDMKTWFINLPDADLAYLPEGTKHFDDYIEAMLWAQDFAMTNRALMMRATLDALRTEIDKPFSCDEESINCHHNYATREQHFGKSVWVTRKGAVQARTGTLGIIPGSMGARSFIVEGLGNRDSLCSCSHGAGRRMSRTKARSLYSVEDHEKATAGIECRKDADVIDETPMAYKDIDAVMAAQADLVKIRHTLRQVLCVKG